MKPQLLPTPQVDLPTASAPPTTQPDVKGPHPFGDDDNNSAVCYRYRKFVLPPAVKSTGGSTGTTKKVTTGDSSKITMLIRSEVNAKIGEDKYVSTKCLNSYTNAKEGSLSWRTHLESQAGAVLANELKNNAFKMGRWVAEVLLGCFGSGEVWRVMGKKVVVVRMLESAIRNTELLSLST